ncbi:hypothetical protein ACOMHN_019817 [Nucella lapillus]
MASLFYLVGTSRSVDSQLSASNASACPEGNHAIWTTFDQCIYTPLDWASFAIGMASIAFWLGVLLPQILENFKDMKGVSSISAGLLFSWIFGDTTNLVGAFLTKQGLFQVLLGVWFVITDIILFSQLIYYHCVFKHRQEREKKRPSTTASTESKRLVLCIMGMVGMTLTLRSQHDPLGPSQSAVGRTGTGRQLLSAGELLESEPFIKTTQEIIGYVFGIVSTFAYFASRSFQIYKNVTQKNVNGLSIVTFVMAVLGNLLYGLAIVLYSVELHYTLLHLPWLLGSWGIMFMDCFIVFQIKKYRTEDDGQMLIVEEHDDEVSPLLNSINSSTDQYGTVHPGTLP